MSVEQWRDIPGYEGRYQVSDQGRVRSIDREVRAVSKAGREYLRPIRGVLLRPGFSRGYKIVNLSPDGTVAVHLLVAKVFIPKTGPEVNHKDGVKTNCQADNLEWTTKRGNQLHAVTAGLNTQAMPVVDPTTGVSYPSISQAARAAKKNHRTVAQWRAAA